MRAGISAMWENKPIALESLLLVARSRTFTLECRHREVFALLYETNLFETASPELTIYL